MCCAGLGLGAMRNALPRHPRALALAARTSRGLLYCLCMLKKNRKKIALHAEELWH